MVNIKKIDINAENDKKVNKFINMNIAQSFLFSKKSIHY